MVQSKKTPAKNPFVSLPKPVKLPKVTLPRRPRGPTVRWSINYDLLYRSRRKK